MPGRTTEHHVRKIISEQFNKRMVMYRVTLVAPYIDGNLTPRWQNGCKQCDTSGMAHITEIHQVLTVWEC